MEITMYSGTVELSAPIKEHIERRLNFGLDRFQHRISRVRVTLEDQNGVRGGVDKLCQVRLSLHPSKSIVRRCTDADAYRAITQAIDLTAEALSRESAR